MSSSVNKLSTLVGLAAVMFACDKGGSNITPENNNTGGTTGIVTQPVIKDVLEISTDTLKSSVADLYKPGSVITPGVGERQYYAATTFEFKDQQTGRTLGVVLNGQIPSELDLKISQGVKTAPKTYTAPENQPFEIIGRRAEKDVNGNSLPFEKGTDKYKSYKLVAKVIVTPFDDFPASAKDLENGYNAYTSSPDNTFDGNLGKPYKALKPKSTL